MSWFDTFSEIRNTDWAEVSEAERTSKVHEVITIGSYAAAAVSMVPIPLVDVALLLPVHAAMVMTIGHVRGRNISDAEAKRVVLELGAIAGLTFAGRTAFSILRKVLLPGLGGLLAAPASFGMTFALGYVSDAYFKDPHLSREELKKVFQDAFREGKSSYSEKDLKDLEEKEKSEAKDRSDDDDLPPSPSARSPKRSM